jgi:hypothetical protein
MNQLPRRYPLHDVRDVETFARRTLRWWLAKHDAFMQPAEFEDAVGWLIGETWILADRYDAARGLSFERFARPLLRMRVVDWLRSRYYDSRNWGDLEFLSHDVLAAAAERDDWRGLPTGPFLDEGEPDRILAQIAFEQRLLQLSPRDRIICTLTPLVKFGGSVMEAQSGANEIGAIAGCSGRTVRRVVRRVVTTGL